VIISLRKEEQMSKKVKELLVLHETLEAENDALANKINDLHIRIDRKQARIEELIGEVDRLSLKYEPYHPPKFKFKFKEWCLSIVLDLKPLSDWWRFNWSNSASYKQICIGPLRLDLYVS
jgi:hypothetical protein